MLKITAKLQDLIKHPLFKCLLLAIAGFIPIYAFAPYNLSVCMAVSLLILLWLINTIPETWSKRRTFGYLFIYGYTYFNTQIYWIFYSMYSVIGVELWLSIVAIICFSAFLGLYITLALFAYTRLKSKSISFNHLLLFPSIWVFTEWVRGWLFGGYSWSDVGYTQVNNQSFHGYFAIFGEYGVSWLCVSLIGALYLILHRLITHKVANKPKIHYRMYMVYAALVLVIGYALEPIRYTKPYGESTTIALIQGNIGVGTKWSGEESLRVYAEQVKQAKADIVMMPETGISQFEMSLPKGYLDSLESSARQNHASLVIGMPLIIDRHNNYVNAAMVITTKGHPYYAKYHLVPFGEYIPLKWLLGPLYGLVNLPMVGFTPGMINQGPLVVGNQKIAFNICFENGFGSELIHAAANSTIMANLSDMVWYGKSVAMDQHLQLSQARALENQRYFIQETNTSITAVINPLGQVQSRYPTFRRGILKDSVQGMIGVTPYEIFGNLLIIGFCTMIILGNWLFRRFFPKRFGV